MGLTSCGSLIDLGAWSSQNKYETALYVTYAREAPFSTFSKFFLDVVSPLANPFWFLAVAIRTSYGTCMVF